MFSTRHLRDDVLILAMEGELPPRRLVQARRHLAGCAACQARMDHLERTLRESADVAPDVPHRSHVDARERLRARMAEHAAEGSSGLTAIVPQFLRAPGPVAVWTAATLALFVIAWSALDGPRAPSAAETDAVFVLPRAALTPGATLTVPLGELCAARTAPVARPIAVSVHRAVFRSYGADFARAAEYELDHLVTPELGGAPDARNLWPQPYGRTAWNAYVKDELEAFFHQRVCDGRMDLATAQREIAGDWIAAYKRHFHTQAPLRDYTQSPPGVHDVGFLIGELAELGIAAPPAAGGPMLLAMLAGAQHERNRAVQAAPPASGAPMRLAFAGSR